MLLVWRLRSWPWRDFGQAQAADAHARRPLNADTDSDTHADPDAVTDPHTDTDATINSNFSAGKP